MSEAVVERPLTSEDLFAMWPYDKQKEIDEAIEEYLDCGVQVVWIVDTMDETVTIYRPGNDPVYYTRRQELKGDSELPEFRLLVGQIFE